MKTKLSIVSAVLLSAVFLLTVSCSKDSDVFSGGVVLPGESGSSTYLGYIQDLGPVTENLREMSVVFTNSGNIYDENTSELVSIEGLNLSFFTLDDGRIPTGRYDLTATDIKNPFTFASNGIMVKNSSVEGVSDLEILTYGTIDVTQVDDHYWFAFTLHTESGKILTGSYEGKMLYADAHN